MTTQHAALTAARWSEFSLDQQVLMIGNEMNRARKQVAAEDLSRLKNCYERVLRLVDLTIQVNARYALRRELLRWRRVIAELYIAEQARAREHDAQKILVPRARCVGAAPPDEPLVPTAVRQRVFGGPGLRAACSDPSARQTPA